MATVDMELAVHQASTRWFINCDPTIIVLRPEVITWHGGSQRIETGPARAAQSFKVIWPGGDQTVPTSDGSTKKLDFILVGKHDATVAVGDSWQEGEERYRIDEVEPFNGYEVKAKGTWIGKVPAHG